MPKLSEVVGVPEIVGGRLVGVCAVTVIAKVGSDALACPSLTLILMLENVPAAVGVPANPPLDAVKVAQAGLFWMLKVSVLPSGSLAVGVKV
jgi:hypothetical protein